MIIVLGAFDGYHLGHQKLFQEASQLASQSGTGWAVLSFTPHPKLVLLHETVHLLFTEEEKKILGEVLEIPSSVYFPFTTEVAAMKAVDFFNGIDSDYGLSGIVVGHDFHFGKDRMGSVETLSRLCELKGIPCSVIPPFKLGKYVVSSTSIREFVARGKMERARTFLGYPFFMRGRVVAGNRRGRSIGFPTANLELPSIKIIPDPGVYAGAALVDGKWSAAAISIGKNRTFGDVEEMRTEVHVVNFDGDLYNKNLNVLFFKRLRSAFQFPSVKRLVAQMKIDVKEARSEFHRCHSAISVFSKIRS